MYHCSRLETIKANDGRDLISKSVTLKKHFAWVRSSGRWWKFACYSILCCVKRAAGARLKARSWNTLPKCSSLKDQNSRTKPDMATSVLLVSAILLTLLIVWICGHSRKRWDELAVIINKSCRSVFHNFKAQILTINVPYYTYKYQW